MEWNNLTFIFLYKFTYKGSNQWAKGTISKHSYVSLLWFFKFVQKINFAKKVGTVAKPDSQVVKLQKGALVGQKSFFLGH